MGCPQICQTCLLDTLFLRYFGHAPLGGDPRANTKHVVESWNVNVSEEEEAVAEGRGVLASLLRLDYCNQLNSEK